MAGEFITPIQMMGPITGADKTAKASAVGGGESAFKNLFGNMIADVNNTQKNLEQQQYLLSTGQIDDAHTVPMAASEAQLAIDLLVQMRNKALESYNELMRISL